MPTAISQRRRGLFGTAGLKSPCLAASTANLTLSGEQTVDGIALVAVSRDQLIQNRCLVKDQTDGSENGIYVVSTGTWQRAEDFDGVDDIVEGTMVWVNRGTANADTQWRVSNIGVITIGTTTIQFLAVSIGAAAVTTTSSEYCPGYTFVFSDTDTFLINTFDVTNLFSVGRRVKFSTGGVDIYGEVSSSSYSTNTTIDLTMENSAVLADVAYTVCLTTGTAAWSPIATDPFGGTGINWITSGLIGATFYIVAVGDGGKLATSTDAGVTWTIRTTSTTEHLLQVDYNEIAEIFIAVGNAGTNLRSTNGTTWTAGGNIMGLVTTGTGHVYGIMHHSPTDEWVIIFNAQTGALDHTARSDTDGATWTLVGAGAAANLHTRVSGFTPQNVLAGVDQGCVIGFQDDLYRLDQPADTAFASIILTTQGGTVSACLIYSGINDRYIIGLSTGNITGSIVGVDDVTFGASQLNGFAYSSLHDRAVAVAADGKIGYIADADIATVDSWTLVNNGFNPLTDVQCVHWDSIDGVFIAGAANGQICRSTNGIS